MRASAEALARAAQAGSREAFEALVARFAGPVHQLLALRTRSAADADDLAQETFLRAWRKLDRYRPELRFSTWLFALARNLATSHHRSAARRPAPPGAPDAADPAEAAGGADPTDELGAREERGRLWALAARVLSAEQLEALWLRYAEDQSIGEIAQVLGRDARAVRLVLFRARRRLAPHVAPKDNPRRDADRSLGAPASGPLGSETGRGR